MTKETMTPPNVPAGKPFPPRVEICTTYDESGDPIPMVYGSRVFEGWPNVQPTIYVSLPEVESLIQEQRMEAAREAESALLEEIYLALRTERNTHGIGFTETDEGKGYRFGTMKMMDKFMELKKAKAAGVKNET